MALTVDDIRNELIGRKFPAILSTDSYSNIITGALRDFTRYNPIIQISAAFITVADVQDYYIYDSDNTVTKGFAAGSKAIRGVWWNPGGDYTSLNIFSPGWQMLSQMLIFTGSYFHQPSQMMVLRQKLAAWGEQFGSQGWRIYGVPGQKSAFLRLYPVPTAEQQVVVEYSTAQSLELMPDEDQDLFFDWVCFRVAEALANLYATTAGIDLLNFADSKDAMQYWDKRRGWYYDRAIAIQSGMNAGEVARS